MNGVLKQFINAGLITERILKSETEDMPKVNPGIPQSAVAASDPKPDPTQTTEVPQNPVVKEQEPHTEEPKKTYLLDAAMQALTAAENVVNQMKDSGTGMVSQEGEDSTAKVDGLITKIGECKTALSEMCSKKTEEKDPEKTEEEPKEEPKEPETEKK